MTAPFNLASSSSRPPIICSNCQESAEAGTVVCCSGTWHCLPCAELADAQLLRVRRRPRQPDWLQARRRRRCTLVRFVTGTQLARCLACTDERTSPVPELWPFLEEVLEPGRRVPPDRTEARRRRLLGMLIDGPATAHRKHVVSTLAELNASWRRDAARAPFRWPAFAVTATGTTQVLTDDDHGTRSRPDGERSSS